jgi:putative transposase
MPCISPGKPALFIFPAALSKTIRTRVTSPAGSSLIGRGRPGRNSSCSPDTPCSTKRRRHLPTVALLSPNCRAIRVAQLVRKTLETKPKGGTHWSVRQIAGQTRLSKSTVHRIWRAFGLEPHRQRHFKLSTDPFFVEKVRDIVGLYLNPPQNAVVLCVDEKSQIQALERTQPMLPIGLGYVEGVTHDYRRHGTTTLFAALDTAKGTVLTRCRQRHRHQEYLDFLRQIDRNVPPDLDVHVIVDNYATHKHPRVKRWLAARPRFHVHFTPTYASWLNQVEIWFNRITQRAIRRGTFRSVKELVAKIDQFVENDNQNARPFVWTATADSIFAKVQRLCERISGTAH